MTTAALETKPTVPPEERFWKRYSPHGEAPLSVSGSLALHVLVGGGLILAGVYLAALLYKPDRNIPVEAVRLGLPGKTGPGGDGLKGVAPGDGLKDDVPEGPDDGPLFDDKSLRPTALTPVERKQIVQQYDDPSSRILQDVNTDAMKRWARLDEGLRKRLSDGLRSGASRVGPPTGKGGSGDKPGGKLKLTQREKRMLRWHMLFTANSGKEYLAQLRSLGAILAIPVEEKKGAEPVYRLVRDLKPGAKLLKEDPSKLERIFWIDDKPQSVKDVVAALGLKLERAPSRFVAFLPEKLEKELFAMEKRYVEKVLKVKFDEDRIEQTRFQVVATAKGHRVEMTSVWLK